MKEIKFSDINLLDIGNNIFLTGSVWSGIGKSYICLFPEQETEKEIALLKMNLEEWKKFLRQSDTLETEILEHGPAGVAKAIVRKSQRLIDARVAWKVYKRDDYRCRYCDKDGVPLTVDHLVVWEVGGPTIEENLVAACRKCNKARGTMPYTKWLKSEYYKKVSQNLPVSILLANDALVNTLPKIKRVKNIRSR